MSIPYVEPKNSLYNELEKSSIIKQIYDKLITIDNFRSYKDDMEFLLYACMMVEHLVVNKKNAKNKIDKKEIIFAVYEKVFGQISKDTISKNIEFLIDNKRIKKIGCFTATYGIVKDWLIRKLQ